MAKPSIPPRWQVIQRLGITASEFDEAKTVFSDFPRSALSGAYMNCSPGALKALEFLTDILFQRINSNVQGGAVIERTISSMKKMIALSKSNDVNQARVSLDIAQALLSRPAFSNAEKLRSLIEGVEMMPNVRPTSRARIKVGRGRRRAQDGGFSYQQSDREILLTFKRTHSRFPAGKELFFLAPSAGGADANHPTDRDSTIKRLERRLTALRREGF